MPHGFELELINDTYMVPFVGKDIPWWDGTVGKATVIKDRPITLQDIYTYTNVQNITVTKKPYYIFLQDQDIEVSKEVFYLSRDDNDRIVNNNVSNRYQVIQHSVSLDKAEELRIKFKDRLKYYSSGVLFGGKLFWVQLEQDWGEVVKDDKLLLTLMFLSNHEGSNTIYTSIQRVVCNNTLQLSLSHANQQLYISHVGDTNFSYNQLLNAFDADTMQFRESLEMFRYWNYIEINSKEIEDLIRYSLNLQEDENFQDNYLFQTAVRLIEDQKGVELMKGKYTAYRVFNALTEATQHVRRNKIYHSLFGKVTNIIDRFNSKVNNL